MDGICYNGMYVSLELGMLTDDEITQLVDQPVMVTEQCSLCNTEKDIHDFYTQVRNSSEINSWCKQCTLDNSRSPSVKLQHKMASSRRRTKRKSLPATLSHSEWNAILVQYNHSCAYCGKHDTEVGALAKEHVMPLSRGGGFTALNIVPACKSCNAKKGAKTPEEVGFSIKRFKLTQLTLEG